DPMPVSTTFPDAINVIVRGTIILVSATVLSLHSPVLAEQVYMKGELAKGARIDVNPHSFLSFLQATNEDFPADCTRQFLDDLLTLGTQKIYNYYTSEIWEKMDNLSDGESEICAMELPKHYAHQPNLDMNKIVR
ncbi:hypothetical protein PMAYCL1PPCAC_10241, partial [Pristionchus mayeri]